MPRRCLVKPNGLGTETTPNGQPGFNRETNQTIFSIQNKPNFLDNKPIQIPQKLEKSHKIKCEI